MLIGNKFKNVDADDVGCRWNGCSKANTMNE